MNIKNILQTIVIAGIISVVVALAIRSDNKVVRGLDGQQGERGATGASGAIGMPAKFGALAGPDIPYPYIGIGGVRRYFNSSGLATATTTPCAFQSLAATSTLVGGGAKFSVGSTTATTITIAKATTPTATTTWIHNASLAANAQGTFIVPGATTTNQIFGPNDWFVVGMSGGNGTFSPTGVCHAIFELYE